MFMKKSALKGLKKFIVNHKPIFYLIVNSAQTPANEKVYELAESAFETLDTIYEKPKFVRTKEDFINTNEENYVFIYEKPENFDRSRVYTFDRKNGKIFVSFVKNSSKDFDSLGRKERKRLIRVLGEEAVGHVAGNLINPYDEIYEILGINSFSKFIARSISEFYGFLGAIYLEDLFNHGTKEYESYIESSVGNINKKPEEIYDSLFHYIGYNLAYKRKDQAKDFLEGKRKYNVEEFLDDIRKLLGYSSYRKLIELENKKDFEEITDVLSKVYQKYVSYLEDLEYIQITSNIGSNYKVA